MNDTTSRRELLQALAAGSAAVIARRGALFSLPAFEPASIVPPSSPVAGELLIRGGEVVNADGRRRADVRIVDGRITEVGRGLRPSSGGRVIEAGGRLILPGGIDPHTHVSPPFADDLTSGSQAALAGGITSIGTFASPARGETPADAVDRMRGEIERLAIAGVFLHATPWPPSPEVAAQLPALVERGSPSIKVFMVRDDFHATLGSLIQVLEAARAAGIVTLVHCEDGTLLRAAVRRLEEAAKTSLANYPESRPIVAEVAATQLAVSLCEQTGAPMHVVHLSSARALDAIRTGRAAGLPMTVETRPMYLHLTEERMRGSDAPLFVGQPPLRSRADSEALWRGLADGSIDMLATDHAPWTREQKLDPALDVRRVRPGVSDLQFVLPMYFSEGVRKRKIPLERFVATTSANAARIFGLAPDRGAVREGAIADVAIWDPALRRTVRAADDLSRSDYSVYEGFVVTGWPVTTIRGGEVVFEEGRVTGQPGSGRLLRRAPWKAP